MSVRAVLAVWSLALVVAGGAVALILSDDRPWPAAGVVLATLIGLAFVGSGLLARVRRPENRTGVLLMLVGFSWFGVSLGASDQSLVWTLGYAEGALGAAFFVHLVLAFPSGRLESKAERRVVACTYVFALVLQPALMLFDDLHDLKCDDCPANAFLIDRNETLAYVIGIPALATALGVLLAVVVILIRRWRVASPPLRRVLAPVYLSSGAILVILLGEDAGMIFAFRRGEIIEPVATAMARSKARRVLRPVANHGRRARESQARRRAASQVAGRKRESLRVAVLEPANRTRRGRLPGTLFQLQAAAFSMMPTMLPPKTATITRIATTMPAMPNPRAAPVAGRPPLANPARTAATEPKAAGAPEKNVGRVRIDRIPSTMAPCAAFSPANTLPSTSATTSPRIPSPAMTGSCSAREMPPAPKLSWRSQIAEAALNRKLATVVSRNVPPMRRAGAMRRSRAAAVDSVAVTVSPWPLRAVPSDVPMLLAG